MNAHGRRRVLFYLHGAKEKAMPRSWTLRELTAWFDRDVVADDGVKVGELKEIVYDYKTMEPVWLGIGTGFLGIRTLLSPAQAATPDNGRLVVEHSGDYIAAQPEAELGAGFGYLLDEQDIYRYFDVPFDPAADLRVLREGEELPGGEAVAS
jgi:hypothetical protein